MVTYLKTGDIDKLLQAYTVEEICLLAGLDDYIIIATLYEAGLLSDLPDEVLPV